MGQLVHDKGGAVAVKVSSIADLETAIQKSKGSDRTSVIVIDTDPLAEPVKK